MGNGTVDGSLEIGYNPSAAGYDAKVAAAANPIISPGADFKHGTITVTKQFQMYAGEMHISVSGPNADQYGRVVVQGSPTTLSAEFNKVTMGGKVVGGLMDVHNKITVNDKINFLTYPTGTLVGNATDKFVEVVPPLVPSKWDYGYTNTDYWFKPTEEIASNAGKLGGFLFRDNGAVAGAFESGTEDKLSGITVRLRDVTGANVLATTTSDANGEYQFTDLDAGMYVVEFVRPTGDRFAASDMTTEDLDSDPDPLTGRVTVTLTDDDVDDVSAGLYANTDPVAVDDSVSAHPNTDTPGNVLPNDSDADGDELTVSLDGGPSHGSLTLNPDGSFIYTPDTDYTGPDSFTYAIADGYDGTDTGTVTITVAGTLAPVGVSDTSYTTPAGPLETDAETGVLANDTDQNNGTLAAVLVSGPAHGTLTLNPDGSFVYTPDATFVGTDSFTYRPTDADGPGNLTTAQIAVTDHPPAAADDEETTAVETPVNIDVLANDSDEDEDTILLLGASDGLHGTVEVDDNGTEEDQSDDFLVYTPNESFNGTDTFTYVIADDYGRLAYGTVTVLVDPSTVTGRVWADADENGIQDVTDTLNIGGRTVYLLDDGDNVIATTTTNSSGVYTFGGLSAGTYKVWVDPSGMTASAKDQGSDDGVDSDIDGSGYSDAFTLLANLTVDIDAGFHAVADPGPGGLGG